MLALDAMKLITANMHHVVHQRSKQWTTHIVIILIQLLMGLDSSFGMPLRNRTPELLLGIVRVLIDRHPINLVINGRFSILEHVAETWVQYAVIFIAGCIAIVFITCTSVRTDGKS